MNGAHAAPLETSLNAQQGTDNFLQHLLSVSSVC